MAGVYTVYSQCGSAGAAMFDPPSLTMPGPFVIGGKATTKNCWLMYAPPIIIHGDYMSIMQGFNHVNMVHRTAGYSPPVSTSAALRLLGLVA